MYNGTAQLKYYKTWIIAWTDPEIGRYYFNWISKAKCPQRQMRPSHITVVRMAPIERPTNLDAWGKYNDKTISFTYDNLIYFQHPYFYLKVWSPDIGEIRQELGLAEFREGYYCYHITIGNVKVNEKLNVQPQDKGEK